MRTEKLSVVTRQLNLARGIETKTYTKKKNGKSGKWLLMS